MRFAPSELRGQRQEFSRARAIQSYTAQFEFADQDDAGRSTPRTDETKGGKPSTDRRLYSAFDTASQNSVVLALPP
jgi:hypothetical protein